MFYFVGLFVYRVKAFEVWQLLYPFKVQARDAIQGEILRLKIKGTRMPLFTKFRDHRTEIWGFGEALYAWAKTP